MTNEVIGGAVQDLEREKSEPGFRFDANIDSQNLICVWS
ncbi:MAG: hypothetical protein ACI8V5_003052, partial [Limisphaerales bacterium]